MKKTLFTLLFCAVALMGFAAKGTSNDPIVFDWTAYYLQNAGKNLWYEIDATPLKAMEKPTLAIYLTNMSETASAHVDASIFVGTSNTSLKDQAFDLAPGQFRIMSTDVSILKSMTYDAAKLYFKVTGADVTISAKKMETARIDETFACKSSTALTVGGAALAVPANVESAYNFNILDYVGNDNKNLKIIITPNGGAAAKIKTSLSYSCPSTSETKGTYTVAAGSNATIVIPAAQLNAVYEDHAYLSIKTNAAATVRVEEETTTPPAPVTPSVTPVDYDWEATDGMDHAVGEKWYAVDYDELVDDLKVPTVRLTSATAGATVTARLAYKDASDNMVVIDTYDWSYTATKNAFKLDVTVLSALQTALRGGKVYYQLTSDKDINFYLGINQISSGSEDCTAAIEFPAAGGSSWMVTGSEVTADYDPTFEDDEESDQFFWMDLTTLKGMITNDTHHDIKFTLTNESTHDNTFRIAQVNCNVALSESSYRTKVVAAGDSYERVIPYSLYSGLEDVVYFRVKATGDYSLSIVSQEAVKSALDVCGIATDFDWRYGHNVAAGVDGEWFYLLLDTVAKTKDLPQIVLTNNGTSTASVKIWYSAVCDMEYELDAPAVYSVPAGEQKTITLTREQFMGYAEGEVYAHVVSNQPVHYMMAFERNNELADRMCEAALDFNWVSGHTQGDTTLWYAIDLDLPKKQNKMIALHMENLSSSTANVRADIATMCPYNNLQGRSTKIGVGKTFDAPELSVATYGAQDTVWVRLKSDQKVRFWAELKDDPASLDTCRDCFPINGAQLLTWGDTVTLVKDTTWFYFETKNFKDPAFADVTYVPQITIMNPTASAISANAAVAFHCPITFSMLDRSRKIAAGGEMVSKVERDMMDGYINKYDTIFVRVVGKNLQFSATMIDPNLGSDCSHAILFQYGTSAADKRGHKQAGGEDMWYKLDINTAHGKKVVAGLANLLSGTNNVTAGIYTKCDAEPLQLATRKITGAGFERDLGDLINGLALDYVFLNVKATDSVHVYAYFDGELPKGEEINVCDDPSIRRLEPNVTYDIDASTFDPEDGKWFYIDVKTMKTNTEGDAELTITPVGATPVHLKAALYWACHTDELPSTRQMTISTPYTKTLTRDAIEALGKDSAFLHIWADADVTFRIDVATINSCMDPVEFDWNYCNTQPADKWVWYHIGMDSLINNPDKDLELNITNLEDHTVTVKVDSIVFTCGESPMMTIGNKTLAAGEVKTQVVDNSLLQDYNLTKTGLSMKVWADGQITICPKLIEAIAGRRDTLLVERTICQGTDFEDPRFINYLDSIDVHNHTIRNLMKDTMVVDSFGFRYDGTFHGDSILIYNLHVTTTPVLPSVIDHSYLESLELEPGKIINKAVTDAIFKELLDSINKPYTSWVDSAEQITWKTAVWDDELHAYKNAVDLTADTLPDPFLDEMGLIVIYTDTCGNELSDTLRLTFSDARCETSKVYNDTVCVGDRYINTLHGLDTVITANTTLKDTCIYVNAAGDQKCDSIVTFNFVVRTSVYNAPEASQYPTMQAGDSLVCAAATEAIKANWYDDNVDAADSIASIVWTYNVNSNKQNSSYVTPDVPSGSNATKAWVAFQINTECGKAIYDTIQITLTEADTIRHIMNYPLCYGDSVQGKDESGADGIWHYALQDTVRWVDTVYNEVKAGSDKKYNGVYEYMLTTVVPVYDSVTHHICDGEEYEWHGKKFTVTTLDLHDTLKTVSGCDSVWGVLNLTVYPKYVTELADTVCTSDNQYVWHISSGSAYNQDQDTTIILQVAGVGVRQYHHTLKTINGCDSLLNLTLTIGQTYGIISNETKSVCLGSDYVWTGHRTISAPDKADTYVYWDSLKTKLGCDSVYKLTLKVVDPQPEWFYATICKDSVYTWKEHGNKQYNADTIPVGIYRDSVWSATELGCDSLTILQITVNPTYLIEETATICDNETYPWQGKTLTAANAGLNTVTYKTVGCNCDSVHTLTLIVNPTYNYAVADTVCFDDYIDLGLNGGKKQIKSSGKYVEKRQTINGCDSIIEHNVWVRTTFALPAADALDTVPQLVCGETPMLDNINAAIAQWLADNVKPENEQVDLAANPILWQIWDLKGRMWVDLDLTKERYNDGYDEKLRYIITTECGSRIESPDFTVVVEKPSTDNIYSIYDIPAFSKYEDWLMMINLNKVTATLAAMTPSIPQPTEDQVLWFQVVGDVDPIGADGLPDGDDINTGKTGYYYTKDMQLTGQYYAIIVIADTITHDPCGMALRTNTIVCKNPNPGGNAPEVDDNNGGFTTNPDGSIVGNKGMRPDFKAPFISPTMVNAGNPIYVYNLNPEIVTTIEVFNLMGERIDAVQVSGTDTCAFNTPNVLTGYFLMNITSEEDTRALKYIAR